MGLRLDPEQTDKQGFPVVSWEEDRNLFAPEGLGTARVACFIRPSETGELQFVSVGTARAGEYEKARPWAALASFSAEGAERHYYSGTETALLHMLGSKTKNAAAQALLKDGAHVMLANFADQNPGIPMHLNCADCRPVELASLHDRLYREFILRRPDLVTEQCGGEFLWPDDRLFVAYEPPPRLAKPWWFEWAVNAVVVGVLGLLGFGFYWLLLR
jgi:hypothetical protein